MTYAPAAGGRSLENTGPWKFDRADDTPRLTFAKFVFGLPGYGNKSPGWWIDEVERS